jgi:hypothetical protein
MARYLFKRKTIKKLMLRLLRLRGTDGDSVWQHFLIQPKFFSV